MSIVGHLILDVISQLKAPSKFMRGDRAHVCVSVIIKFDSEKMLEDILIWACIVGRTETVDRYNG